jgi:acid phosphatase
VVGAAALAIAGLTAITAPAHAAAGVPRYDHVVLVVEENHSYNEIINGTAAPYIKNTLAAGGVLFTNSFAIEHPSQPNYIDLFSGSNQAVTSDSCPHTFTTANEAAQLLAAGDSWSSYSEGLPSVGSTVCTSGAYARKHNPWTNFSNVPAADNLPFTSFPSPASFASLPTVSWVIPNLNDDMHDGTIAQGDTWLRSRIDAYAQWARNHNSLLIVTWDEDDSSMSNQIPTILYGAGLTTGRYSERINHYRLLRTIEDMYGLPYAGAASSVTPITDVWSTA